MLDSLLAYIRYIVSALNAILIQVMNFIYGRVSRKLNDFQNHRTDTEVQNYWWCEFN